MYVQSHIHVCATKFTCQLGQKDKRTPLPKDVKIGGSTSQNVGFYSYLCRQKDKQNDSILRS